MSIFAQLADIVGIIGVSLVLLAYYLLSTHRLTAHAMKYQLLNFSGAWLILYSLYFHWNTASVVIEISWITISVLGMYRCYRAKRRGSKVANDQAFITSS